MHNLENITAKICFALSEINAKDWNKCCKPYNPFTSYSFLNALEQSGCVSKETG